MSASTECFKAVTNVLEEKQTLAIKLTQQSHPRTRSSYASLPPPEANDDTIEVNLGHIYVIKETEIMCDCTHSTVLLT